MKWMVGVGLALAVLAPSTAGADDVALVAEASQVSGCERLGEVSSGSSLGGLLAGAGHRRSLEKLKRRAAALGATHLHLLKSDTGMMGSVQMGVAYRCPTASPPSSPPAP